MTEVYTKRRQITGYMRTPRSIFIINIQHGLFDCFRKTFVWFISVIILYELCDWKPEKIRQNKWLRKIKYFNLDSTLFVNKKG